MEEWRTAILDEDKGPISLRYQKPSAVTTEEDIRSHSLPSFLLMGTGPRVVSSTPSIEHEHTSL